MRVVAFVDEGHGHREAARHFRVSPKFVNDLIKLRRETGSLAPRPQGNGGGYGKLAGVTGRIEARVADKGEITLDELAAEPARTHGIDMHRGTVWALRGLGLTHKKKTFRRLSRSERTSPNSAASGSRSVNPSWPTIWNAWSSSMKPRSGPTWPGRRAGRPAGSVAALRHDRLEAPWVIDGAMNSEMFTLYAETRLVPTLREGDVVILDNLSSHKAPAPRRPFAPSAPGSCSCRPTVPT